MGSGIGRENTVENDEGPEPWISRVANGEITTIGHEPITTIHVMRQNLKEAPIFKIYPALKKYILSENWVEAAKFGDHICRHAVIQNEDWIWNNTEITNDSSTTGWNSTSWGNLAILIVHGQPFPERRQEIARLIHVVKHLSAKWTSTC